MDFLVDSWFMRDVFRPVLDVALLTFFLYKGYTILVQTRAMQLIRGALTIGIIYALAYFLKLGTLLWILNMLAPGLVIGVAIVFQPELRKIFTRIGQGHLFHLQGRGRPLPLEAVLSSLEVLAGRRRGALLVFPRKIGLKNIVDTGTRINGEVSSSLIISIFGHDTPLHDGAVVIENGKLVSAGCFLPLSHQSDIRRSFGTRHRAALGLSEESDALIVVASEETGALSLAYDSRLHYDLTISEMRYQLKKLLNLPSQQEEEA